MAYIYFLIGVGVITIAAWIAVAAYEHSRTKQFETE